MDFVRIKAMLTPTNCTVGDIQNFRKDYLLLSTRPLQESFPNDTSFIINARTMKSVKIKPIVQGDLLPNGNSVLLAGEHLANILVEATQNAEQLETSVCDEKQKNSKPYRIVRPLVHHDVIATPTNQLKVNALSPDEVLTPVHLLEFDFSNVPQDVKLLVPKGLKGIYLARRDFADDILSRFSGVLIRELNDPIS